MNSQANWIEWFREQQAPVAPERPPFWERLTPYLADWEEWLTFALATITFLAVTNSVQSAHWVDNMPSLSLVAFLALLTGFGLARVRIHEVYLHLIALLIGAPIVILSALSFMGETSLTSGLNHFWYRFGDWIDVVRSGGITTDNMPFVTMVLALAWIGGYLSSWAIFRWRNAWLALIPGGAALLTNISYLPGQFSATFVLFLFGAILLLMRVNVLNRMHEWQARGYDFPQFISLRLLNATLWIALGILIIAWWAPLASESKGVAHAWDGIVSPFSNASADWGRLFSSIDSKRDVPLHSFGTTLPLQGKVQLSDRVVAQVDFGDQSNEGRNLVANVYDTYTADGWLRGDRTSAAIGPNGVTQADGQPAAKSGYQNRKDVPVNVTVDTDNGVLLAVGQPVQSSVDSKADTVPASGALDIVALHPKHGLNRGDTYSVVGSISEASEDQLRSDNQNYPDYVRQRYLQLPTTLPQRVRDLAQQWTTGQGDAYDRALTIESQLRQNYPQSYNIPIVPPGRDAVDLFLFDTKQGYSDYQASAMVVLLRAAGVPARLATGYAVDEYDLNLHKYIVREKSAESWPEVFFPTYGWVEFSPFGGAPLVSRPSTAGGDTPGPDVQQDPIIKGGGPNLFGGEFIGDVPLFPGPESGGSFHVRHTFNWLPVYLGLTALAMLLIGAGALRLAWELPLRGLDYPSKTWEKTLRLSRWLRMGPTKDQTPREFAARLAERTKLNDEPRAVADGYLRTRYGRADANADAASQRTLNHAWTRVRNRLLKRLLRLK
jgi:hypothetical protein